jgi:hypothetical protein
MSLSFLFVAKESRWHNYPVALHEIPVKRLGTYLIQHCSRSGVAHILGNRGVVAGATRAFVTSELEGRLQQC